MDDVGVNEVNEKERSVKNKGGVIPAKRRLVKTMVFAEIVNPTVSFFRYCSSSSSCFGTPQTETHQKEKKNMH